ncbi:hypothetical protein OAF42_03135 [Planctomicrobium sp.]|jgi:hypothetical protein|nr:hypothetical protein [Planctomicrobium sp.]MBT5019031.1 hypothetical protein [Planctomicrobium sp.]MDB4733418.1 hypothetical protein [Planctomicrobium sp.]
MKRIAELLHVGGEAAPAVDYDNTHLEWDKIHEGKPQPSKLPVEDDIGTQRFFVNHPDKYTWDCYRNSGHYGFISKRFRDAVQPYCSECFDFWPVMLDDVEFFIIRRVGVIDCLDRESSEFDTFPDTDKIMIVDRYAFHKEKIPDICMFSIPDQRGPIFFTNGLTRLLLPLQLNGVEFTYTETKQGDSSQTKWNPEW